MELALESQESQRKVMYDPSKAHYFLQYTDGSGNRNGTIYNERQTPGDQYFWNFSEPEASAYYISSVLGTTANPHVLGSFTDDVTGLPAEHDQAPARMRLSPADVAALQRATSVTNGLLVNAAVAAGKYIWAAFGNQDGVGQGPSPSSCQAWMAARCTPAYQARAITQALDKAHVNASIASFLITRPPIAFVGFGWESDMRDWDPAFLWQVGEPQGGCVSEGNGVFSREWGAGKVSLNCGDFSSTIPTF